MYPKRGAIAAGLTAAGLALLFSFKTPDRLATLATVTSGSGSNSTGTSSGGTTSTKGATSGSTDDTSASGATATPSASASANAASGTANGTVTGPVVDTQYGPVQVAVTFSNGKITDIAAVQLPSDRMRSAQISQYAEPILRQEALQAQSAQIDLVSGATYTSAGYEQSLQAVLDQAGA
jgi:uncharacterized protein with FMN-binding domain